MVQRISEFDIWRPGYANAVVSIYVAGTTTLANIYTDEALSTAAANPQTLEGMEAEGGTRYGKFAAPLYTGQSYYLSIDGIENTGVIRPSINTLDGEDASAATIQATGSNYDVTIADAIGREVNVANFGSFVAGGSGVAATNTATMELAIAALTSGGVVKVPAGLYKVNDFSIPEGVIIEGQGIDATTLQSVLGSESFTLTGDRSGFRNITLDGNTLSTGSVGVRSENNDFSVFTNVLIKRFETGIYFSGGKGFFWQNFSIDNVENTAKLYGEGAPFEDMTWMGGVVSTATSIGVDMSYVDDMCHNLKFIGVGFETCTEYAVNINGAQNVYFDANCWWDGNTKTINIQDDTDPLTPATEQQNDVINVLFDGGRIDGGIFTVTGTIQNVVLSNMKLKNLEFDLDTPLDNFLLLKDCYEESGITLSGETTRLIRTTTSQNGSSFGITTDSSASKAWSISLEPGQQIYFEAKIIAKGRNVAQRAMYHTGCGAFRPGSSLNYDTQTSNFTTGAIVTGQSSGASARIQADSDSGTTGTLTLTDISGEFIDNEIITDDNGTPGSATVNGTLINQNASLDSVGAYNIRSIYETVVGYGYAIVANGPEIELRVNGTANNTLEWTVHVDVVST